MLTFVTDCKLTCNVLKIGSLYVAVVAAEEEHYKVVEKTNLLLAQLKRTQLSSRWYGLFSGQLEP